MVAGRQQRWREPLLEHFCLELDAKNEQAAQGLTRLVGNPAVVMDEQAGIDLPAIGEVYATHRGVVADFVINFRQFTFIMFKSAHGQSIT